MAVGAPQKKIGSMISARVGAVVRARLATVEVTFVAQIVAVL
jgi:hypothetical protein